ncbi:MAG: nucleoside deaminase [Clostridium argentinense]|uniref:tRNA-specific adenosine deaminase n=1 Tax=Clostridium faecium TaxID=2762223 RepID=A0ABR8YUX3_9CLOT|nr:MULTISPECIES: nucleoside deaminase [Clostridium]MBD8047989.1 nucleoside deaminase [Clostridium faecium]MBS5824108.1 nucleoside deaminase [Clostridium argentinense]MDU1350709.1 nucleoside deaminase [Clostridium argentinense]
MEDNFMNEAIIEAEKALKLEEIPVGAVIVKDNKIVARAHNLKESLNDSTCHAEILAIKEASKVLNSWRLTGCSMYVTLEPCPMCAGAIVQSRLSKLYIGTFDERSGACGSVMNIVQNDFLNHWVDVKWTYEEKCSKLLQNFFKEKRRINK